MKLDCQAMEERLVDYLYDELEPEERASVEAHLAGCPGCAEQVGSMSSTRSLMADLSPLAPSRDDSYVLQIASAQARAAKENRGLVGALSRFGRWLGENPALVALPVAASVLFVIVGVNVADNVRDLFGGSADALAGQETRVAAPGDEGELARQEKGALEEFAAMVAEDGESEVKEETPSAEPAVEAPGARGSQARQRPPGQQRATKETEASPPPSLPPPTPQRRAMASRAPPSQPAAPPPQPDPREQSPRPAREPPASTTASTAASTDRAAVSADADVDVDERDFLGSDDSASAGGPAPRATTRLDAPAENEAVEPETVEAVSRQAERSDVVSSDLGDDTMAPATAESLGERSIGVARRSAGGELFGGSGRAARAEGRSRRAEERARRTTLEEGRRMAAEGRCEEAVALLDGFSSSLPEAVAEAHVLRARCLQRLGRDEEARSAWRSAAEASPEGRWGGVAREALQD